MEFICFSTRGGLWGLRMVNLFMPPLNKPCLNSIPCKGIYRKTVIICSLILNTYLIITVVNAYDFFPIDDEQILGETT